MIKCKCGNKSKSIFCEKCGNLLIIPINLQKKSFSKKDFFFHKEMEKITSDYYYIKCSDKERQKINDAILKSRFRSDATEEDFLYDIESWDNWYGLGELRVCKFDLEHAILAKNRSYQLLPTFKLILFEIGGLYYLLKQYDKARDAFLDCRGDLYNFLLVHTSLAETYMALNNYDDAIEIVQEVIDNKRKFFRIPLSKKRIKELWFWIANLHYMKGIKYYEEAIEAINRSLQIDMKNEDVWRLKLGIYYDLKQFNKIKEICEDIIDKDTRNYLIWLYYAISLRELNEIEKSNIILDQMLKNMPNNIDSLLAIAINHNKAKKYEEAISGFKKCLELDPKSISALNWLADTYYKMKNYDATVKISNEAIKIKEDNFLAWNLLGAALRYQDKYEESLNAFNKALELEPDNYIILANKAMLFNRMEDYQKAIEFANKSLAIEPENYFALCHLGYTYFKMGRFNEAESLLDKSIEKNSNFYGSWLHKARIQFELQNYEMALEYCTQCLKLDPKCEDALELKSKLENLGITKKILKVGY